MAIGYARGVARSPTARTTPPTIAATSLSAATPIASTTAPAAPASEGTSGAAWPPSSSFAARTIALACLMRPPNRLNAESYSGSYAPRRAPVKRLDGSPRRHQRPRLHSLHRVGKRQQERVLVPARVRLQADGEAAAAAESGWN